MSTRRFLILLSLLALAAVGTVVYFDRQTITDWVNAAQRQAVAPPAVSYQQTQADQPVPPTSNAAPETPPSKPPIANAAPVPPANVTPPAAPPAATPPTDDKTLPSTFNLAVPFTSQAPTGDWSEPYQDACEEASLYMVHEFYQGHAAGKIDPAEADQAILQIVKFEQALFGFYESTSAAQTALLGEQMYGYARIDVLDNPTVDDIKAQITAGHPVIVPEDGQMLGNPNYTAPGPIYHMLVIKGYTKTQFITNDSGTRNGENYAYDFDVIMNAMHDWNGGDVLKGKAEMIIVYPN